MAATQEELSLDEGKAKTDEAYAYLQRKKQDSTRSYADKDKIWLLQQTLLLSSHRSDAEVLECLGLSLALSPPLNGWWFKTFMLPGDAVPISMSTPELLKHGFQIYKPLFVSEVKYIVSLQECRYEKLIETLKLIPFEWQDSEGYVGVSERGLKVLHKELLDERKREAIKNKMSPNQIKEALSFSTFSPDGRPILRTNIQKPREIPRNTHRFVLDDKGNRIYISISESFFSFLIIRKQTYNVVLRPVI